MSEELEKWDGRYKEGFYPWHIGRPCVELERWIEDGTVVPGRALELGCGFGSDAIYLAQKGFQVTAVDLSPTVIEAAKQRAGAVGARVDFQQADLLSNPDLGGPYDFLYDRGVYHVLRGVSLEGYLRLLETVSHPGTLYLSLSGNAKEPHDPGPPTVSEEELRRELGSLFDMLDLHEFRWESSDQMPIQPLAWSALMRRRS